METQNQIYTTQSTRNNSSRKFVIVCVLLILIVILAVGIYIMLSKRSLEKTITESSPVSVEQEDKLADNLAYENNRHSLILDSNMDGVQSIFTTYSLIGRVYLISSNNDQYTFSLVNQQGVILSRDLQVDLKELTKVEEFDIKNNKYSELHLSDLKRNDLVEVRISEDLKTNTYLVTYIIKRVE